MASGGGSHGGQRQNQGSKSKKNKRMDSDIPASERLEESLENYVAELQSIKQQLVDFRKGINWPTLLERLLRRKVRTVRSALGHTNHQRAYSRYACPQPIPSPSSKQLNYSANCQRRTLTRALKKRQEEEDKEPLNASTSYGLWKRQEPWQNVRVVSANHGPRQRSLDRPKPKSGCRNIKATSATIQGQIKGSPHKLRQRRCNLNRTQITLWAPQVQTDNSLISIYAGKQPGTCKPQEQHKALPNDILLEIPFSLYRRPKVRSTTRATTSNRK